MSDRRYVAATLPAQEIAPHGRYRERMKRASALDRILSAFAEAVEAGDFAQAEGWISAARDNFERTADAPLSPRSVDRSAR
ncbi:MAG: hypothetical protein ACJ76P_07930 [Actinomycetota bacterium]